MLGSVLRKLGFGKTNAPYQRGPVRTPTKKNPVLPPATTQGAIPGGKDPKWPVWENNPNDPTGDGGFKKREETYPEHDFWAQKQAEAQAAENTSQITAADLKDDILSSVQTLLIENMRMLIAEHSIARTPIRDLRQPGLIGTEADLMSYTGNPDVLSSALLNPPTGS